MLFTTDEGLNWREYKFTDHKIRVRSIVTVPSDTSRRFILFRTYGRSYESVAVILTFRLSRVCSVRIHLFSCHPLAPLTQLVV